MKGPNLPDLSAKKLNDLVDELAIWYAETRLWLIEKLEEDGYPYGHEPTTRDEQFVKYLQMTPQDFNAMYQQLLERYRGLPDQRVRAVRDMQRYRDEMEDYRLDLKMRPQEAFF